MSRLISFLLPLLLLFAGCDAPVPTAYQGYVEGEYVRVAAPFAGNLARLAVQRGGWVQAGDTLYGLEQESERAARQEAEQRLLAARARLENLRKGRRPAEIAAIEARRAQARASFELSAAQLARDESLAAAGYVSAARLDQSRSAHEQNRARLREVEAELAIARLAGRADEIRAAQAEAEAAQAALAQAEWRLAQKTVRAPVAGLVQDVFYVEGEWVNAGSPVLALLPPGNVKVRFFVPEAMVGRLRLGQRLKIGCDGCRDTEATLSFIAPQAEYTPPVIYSKESRTKLVFMVEAKPVDPGAMALHPGQPVDVWLR